MFDDETSIRTDFYFWKIYIFSTERFLISSPSKPTPVVLSQCDIKTIILQAYECGKLLYYSIILTISCLDICDSVVWTYDTFENNVGIDHKLPKYLKESCVLGFDQQIFSENCFC